MRTPDWVPRWWGTVEDWATRPAVHGTWSGGLLAFSISMFIQGANRRVFQEMETDRWIYLFIFALYGLSLVSRLAAPWLLLRFNPKWVITWPLIGQVAATAYVGMIADTGIKFAIGYAVWGAAHFAAFVPLATIVRMTMPKPRNEERSKGSLWSTVCYNFAMIASIVMMVWPSPESLVWRVAVLAAPILALVVFWLHPELRGYKPTPVAGQKVKLRKLWFDKKPAKRMWLYSPVLVVSSVMLQMLQFRLEHMPNISIFGFVVATAMFVLSLSQFCSGAGSRLPLKVAEKWGDEVVTFGSLLFAGAAAWCFSTGSVYWSITGGVLLGFAKCAGRISFSQLSSTHSENWGRGVSMYYGVAIWLAQFTGPLLGLFRTFGGASIEDVFLIACGLVGVSILCYLVFFATQWWRKRR